MANKMKSLMESILGKMTDESGLFQGGEQGRAFGRIRDLFGGGGAHENIDAAINDYGSSGGSGGYPESPGIGNQPDKYFMDILKASAPSYINRPMDSSEIGRTLGSRVYGEANKIDQIMQAILDTGFGEKLPYSDPKNAPSYEKGRARWRGKEYEGGEMTPEEMTLFEEGAWYPEAPSYLKKRSFEGWGGGEHRYGDAPRDITDIVGLMDLMKRHQEE